MRVLLFLGVAVPTVLAQSNWTTPRFSPGVTVGVEAGRISGAGVNGEESKRWTAGPSVDISLAGNWSVTVNPHYKRLGSSYFWMPNLDTIPDGSSLFTGQRLRAHSLEVPLIGKYHFGSPQRRVRLFAGTGYAFRTAWVDSRWQITQRKDGELTVRPGEASYRAPVESGVVAALGAAIRHGQLIFTPEIRYTRWNANQIWDRHQAEVMLTIRWGGRKN